MIRLKTKNKISTLKKRGINKKEEPEIKELEVNKVAKVINEKKQKEILKSLKEDLNIQPIKTLRDSVKKTPLQENYNMLPPGLTLIVGSTGSGKTVTICNILSKKNMLKGYFDRIIVFCLSPCPMLEDCLQLDKKDIIQDDNPDKVREILNKQKRLVEEKPFEEVPHILLILDDIIQSRKFLRSSVIAELAFAATHSKISIFLATQSYMAVPREIRVNAHAILLFSGCKLSELDRLEKEYGSQYLNKKDFRKLVQYAIADDYNFLFINNTNPDRSRKYHKGFSEVLAINKNKEY